MVTVELDLLGLNDGDWLLDAGCGEGRHVWEACKRNHSHVIAFDIDIESLRKAKYTLSLLSQKGEVNGNCHLLQADINRLPFKDGAFNKIICSEVLEHMPRDGEVVGELVRVLDGDGAIGVSVPHHLAESICWRLSRGTHKDIQNRAGYRPSAFPGTQRLRCLSQSRPALFLLDTPLSFRAQKGKSPDSFPVL